MTHDHFAEQRLMCSGATQTCRIRLWLPHELTSLCGTMLVNAAVRKFKCQKESLLIFLQLSVQVNSNRPFYKQPFCHLMHLVLLTTPSLNASDVSSHLFHSPIPETKQTVF